MARPLVRRSRSAGVALLLVMVVLLLVATLATEIALTARTHAKLADHAMDDFLLRSVVDGRRNVLVAHLRFDASHADNLDTEGDAWSRRGLDDRGAMRTWGQAGGSSAEDEPPPSDPDEADAAARVYRNRDVEFEAWCEDERSKINLRGLLWEEDTPTFLHTREALVRLIDRYREHWGELDVSDSDAREMVTDLVEWLQATDDNDDNPKPPTKNRQGRLLSLEDVFRVPSGKWTPELCWDVRDPEQAEEGDFSRRSYVAPDEEQEGDDDAPVDARWEWANGVPGLFRYLTVWGEGTTGNQPKINVNTAPKPVLEALFDAGQEDLAAALLEHRRSGGDPYGSASGDSSSEQTGGWIKAKADLSKVEGMGDDLGRYPRLDFFAETKSATFSIRVVATMVTGNVEGEDDEGPRDIRSDYQYREIVQRTQQGVVSLYAERRHDPLLDAAE